MFAGSNSDDSIATSKSFPSFATGWSSDPFGNSSLNDRSADVLLIDDDAKSIQPISSELKASGLNVVVARDENEGLTKLSSRSFCIVLIHWARPDSDVIRVLKEIRAR